jgi:hypothetical protein
MEFEIDVQGLDDPGNLGLDLAETTGITLPRVTGAVVSSGAAFPPCGNRRRRR